MNTKFEVYFSRANDWRWRMKAGNGEIVAMSSEGYNSKQGAINSAHWVKVNAPSSTIEV